MLFLLKGTINIFLLTSKGRWLKRKSIVFRINLNRHITSVSKMTSARSLGELMTFFLPGRALDLPLS